MPSLPFAYLGQRRDGNALPCSARLPVRPRSAERTTDTVDSSFPTEGMSIPRQAGLFRFLEVVWLSVLAFAIPRGTAAIVLAFAALLLLATVIGRRVGRSQPTSTNLKTRELQRPVPSVTSQRRTSCREQPSHTHDPQET